MNDTPVEYTPGNFKRDWIEYLFTVCKKKKFKFSAEEVIILDLSDKFVLTTQLSFRTVCESGAFLEIPQSNICAVNILLLFSQLIFSEKKE